MPVGAAAEVRGVQVQVAPAGQRGRRGTAAGSRGSGRPVPAGAGRPASSRCGPYRSARIEFEQPAALDEAALRARRLRPAAISERDRVELPRAGDAARVAVDVVGDAVLADQVLGLAPAAGQLGRAEVVERLSKNGCQCGRGAAGGVGRLVVGRSAGVAGGSERPVDVGTSAPSDQASVRHDADQCRMQDQTAIICVIGGRSGRDRLSVTAQSDSPDRRPRPMARSPAGGGVPRRFGPPQVERQRELGVRLRRRDAHRPGRVAEGEEPGDAAGSRPRGRSPGTSRGDRPPGCATWYVQPPMRRSFQVSSRSNTSGAWTGIVGCRHDGGCQAR